MNRAHPRRVAKTLLAAPLLAAVVLSGVAAASPADEVDELVDDLQQYVEEDVPHIVPSWIDYVEWLVSNPPDPQDWVDAVQYPEPDEFLTWVIEQAPYWAESAQRVPSRVVITLEHERKDDSFEVTMRKRESYRHDPDGRGGRFYTSPSHCTGPIASRECDLYEEVLGGPATPKEVVVARHTQRTSNETAFTVRASVSFQDSDLDQDHNVTTPAVPCSSPIGDITCDAVGSVLD